LDRIPEPELMDDHQQAKAYADADYSDPHNRLVELVGQRLGNLGEHIADLGCGPADVTVRLAHAHQTAQVDGYDGSAAMLALGRQSVEEAGLSQRVTLKKAYLPFETLPGKTYDTIVSSSLLHHLADPAVLWETIRALGRKGTRVFVWDLRRPPCSEDAEQMVQEHAAEAPKVLRRDFYNSLLAAYEPAEIEAQLAHAGLPLEVEVASDRHVIVWGYL